MAPRAWVLIALAVGATSLSGATWLIHRSYQAALQHELEDSTGQVGQLRAQAELLRTEQEARRREIEAIRGEIKTAEAALAVARSEAEESRCQATHARVDAAVTVKQVSCFQQYAQQAQCSAERERSRADNTLFGALLGAGLAVATGGSSLLLTAGGGLLGASSGGGPCPAPECSLDPKKLRRLVLAEQGLKQLPTCTIAYEPQFLVVPEELAERELAREELARKRRKQEILQKLRERQRLRQ